ncbi:MAG: UDP-N-acetylglucosamine 1-carboxyvinyltransferase [Planctomycetota bacterium]|nr:MAG: UDP-N-acetylglucosamine 1-carboxyvinyltransferase [Planctomycetota bacterium]
MNGFEVFGGTPLKGEVQIGGAKNAAIKHFIASLLTPEASTFYGAPQIGDLAITQELCESVGCKVSWGANGEVTLETPEISKVQIPKELGRKNRMSIMMLPPLLHRVGEAMVPQPGGCKIGSRPVNFHVNGIAQMGAEIEYKDGYYIAKAKKLKGAKINLPFPSVSATENLIMAATLAEGTTTIQNAAMEPEIFDLIQYLQKMGALIEVGVNRKITIEGVKELHGAEHHIIPDRLEAASYAVAALATKGDVFVRRARQCDMITFLNALRRMGGSFDIDQEGIRFFYTKPLKAITIETDVHPGFMTDWQQPFVLLLTQSEGVGIVHETVYENRLGYVEGLKKMGGEIYLFQKCLGDLECRFRESSYFHSAVVKGPTPLKGAHLHIPDLRGGCSYFIAAVVASGRSVLTGVELLDRGYERIDEKFRSLGASVRRISLDQPLPKAA